jgi:hypothetical protein
MKIKGSNFCHVLRKTHLTYTPLGYKLNYHIITMPMSRIVQCNRNTEFTKFLIMEIS